MYQRDYILRMLQMIAELIAGILGLIKKGKYEEASEEIDQAYNDMLKEDAAFFDNIPLESITDTLLNEHNYTNGHLEILAELLFAQGELYYAQDKKEVSLRYYEKAKVLLEYVISESTTFSMKNQTRLTGINEKIAELNK